ncbi:MAG: NAD(P)-dependent alcohol dehydrogenase [Bdellovibrionales bacterium]|nr:NAD(P)-dependent alcohol dehydrogenase [Bdellovibrionales bacterium]
MSNTRAYASLLASAPLVPFTFDRRDPGPRDVVIEIHYCGICHSDIHQVRDEWGGATFPMVPGHEIVGVVSAIGKKVKRFRVGDHAGVGCLVDSCRKCANCKDGEEQFCQKGAAFTYNGTEMDRKTPTQGGYSSRIVVDEAFALKISKKLPLDRVAPLLCAGITTYSPLKRFGVKKGQTVGVVGLGGLGHMAVKIAAALGAHVTVFSTSAGKQADAKRLGAKGFVNSRDTVELEKQAGKFDFIIDTVSAPHDLNVFLGLLKRDGTMVIVGVPQEPAAVEAFSLIGGRRRLAGSLIGGIRETQEMLDFCAKKKILSDVEVIPASKINEAYERTVRGDVKYRFVIDASTF